MDPRIAREQRREVVIFIMSGRQPGWSTYLVWRTVLPRDAVVVRQWLRFSPPTGGKSRGGIHPAAWMVNLPDVENI
jgi:hypothetical protein